MDESTRFWLVAIGTAATLSCGGATAAEGEQDAPDGAPVTDGGVVGDSAAGWIDGPRAETGAVLDSSSGIDGAPSDASTCTVCGAVCVDPTTDQHHCGACFHDCLGTACSAGLCAPTVLYAADLPGTTDAPMGIAVDATSVYWAAYVGGAIRKVPTGGGAMVTLASDQSPTAVAVDATSVYWVTATGAVRRAALDGSSPFTFQSGGGQAESVTVDAQSLYWSGSPTGTVSKAPLGGGPVTILSSGQGHPLGMAVDSSWVYWTTSGVSRVGLDGGTTSVLAQGGGATGVAVDSENVYWASFTAIMKLPLAGGSPTVVAPVQGGAGNGGVAADGTHVYWTEFKGGRIMKAPRSGGAPAVLASSVGGSFPHAIAVDATSVYWTDDYFDGVLKVAK
jgi:sugar lactone lactonase YvrE